MSASQPLPNTVAEVPATSLRRAVPLTLVLVGGIVLSAAMAFAVRQYERERFENEFERRAQNNLGALQFTLRGYDECLFTLRDVYDASDDVRPEEFRKAASDVRGRHRGLLWLRWIPHVPAEKRSSFEAEQRKYLPDYVIHDGRKTANGKDFAPAPERQQYFPISYCEPAVANEAAFGLDLSQGPYRQVLARAAETGNLAASRRLPLGHDGESDSGFVLALPVFSMPEPPEAPAQRREQLRGCLVGAVRFRDLLAYSHQSAPASFVDLLLVDETPESTEPFLASYVDGEFPDPAPTLTEFRDQLQRAFPLPVADRAWLAVFRPAASWPARPALLYPVAFFIGGIILTALLARLLFFAQQRTLIVQRLVRERTAELHITQEELRKDIQQRRKAEERYRAFVEQSREAIWRFELQEPLSLDLPEQEQIAHYYQHAYLAEANDAFAKMYGYERAKEMIGARLEDLMPPGDPANIEHLRQYVRSGFRLTNSESHEIAASGEVRIFLNNITGIIEDGRLARTWGTQRDITERRRAEEGCRRAEARLETALAAADLGTWEWDLETDSITLSKTTEEIFGFVPGTFHGGLADYLQLVHPDHRDLVEKRLRAVAREGGSVAGEIRIVRRDGACRWVSSRGDVVRNEQGSILRVVGAVLDVTEQHEAAEKKAAIERRLQESQKLESLGILAGGVAHDFNNLLTGILGNTSLARMDLPEDSPVQLHLQTIEHTARRAAELCKQMLAYAGKGRFIVQHLDLSGIARETAQLVQPSISKEASLEFDLASNLPVISADATQMRQIIMNLLINASDALGGNAGVIRLKTGLLHADAAIFSEMILSPNMAQGDYVFLEISDTGCGMSAEIREKIFDPFFTTKFTGRGLGLAAVLGIVRGHGGALKVSSTLGRGSTFQLLLPCAEGPIEQRIGTPPASTWRGTGAVLVVDDDETVRLVAGRILGAFGFEVVLANNGREAIAHFREEPRRFRAVLLDLTMPEMGGADTFTELRRLDPEVKVVLMSGFDEQDAVGRFRNDGLAGFVQKPFTPEELRERFQSIFAATLISSNPNSQRANGSTAIGSPQ